MDILRILPTRAPLAAISVAFLRTFRLCGVSGRLLYPANPETRAKHRGKPQLARTLPDDSGHTKQLDDPLWTLLAKGGHNGPTIASVRPF